MISKLSNKIYVIFISKRKQKQTNNNNRATQFQPGEKWNPDHLLRNTSLNLNVQKLTDFFVAEGKT